MWDVTCTIVESIVYGRRGIEFEKSVRREGRRADFFSRVLNGTFSRDELAEIGQEHGLDARTDYWLTLLDGQNFAADRSIEKHVPSKIAIASCRARECQYV